MSTCSVNRPWRELTDKPVRSNWGFINVHDDIRLRTWADVESWDPRFVGVCRKDPEGRDFIYCGLTASYVSGTLRKFLETVVPEQVHFLPLRVQICGSSKVHTGFSRLVLKTKAGQEFQIDNGEPMIVREPDSDFYESFVLVNDAMEKLLTDRKFRGLKFQTFDPWWRKSPVGNQS
jgi:hypothetical protein